MTVYVLELHDWESIDFGPVMATRELAEQLREQLNANNPDPRWSIEEYQVHTELPARVTMHYAQRTRNGITTGTSVWWDYEAATLPRHEHIAWATTEAAARQALNGSAQP
jgi:hypothetical protein